jgi:hypothetical protein
MSSPNQGFDNNEFLMFVFKNSRIPLDVGCEFCGSSGEEEEEEEEKEQKLTKGSTNTDSRQGVVHLHQVTATGPCTGTGESECFLLGLPLDSRKRVKYQRRRPSNWKPLVHNWSPEHLFDVKTYGVEDGGSMPRTSTAKGSFGTLTNNGFSGYLLRRSQKEDLVWYRRWCVVRDDAFWCCKARHNQRHIRKIPLDHSIDVYRSKHAHNNYSLRYCFEVKTNRRVYMFRACDSSERDQWMRALQSQVHVAVQNERFRVAEYTVGDQEYRASHMDATRLERVTSSLACLLEDEGARQIFDRCLCEWQCQEGLWFFYDVEHWRLAAEQLAVEILDAAKGGGCGSGGGGGGESRECSGDGSGDRQKEKMQSDNVDNKKGQTTMSTSRSDGSSAEGQTSFRIGSGRFEGSVSMLWEQRQLRREQQSLRARALELCERAKDIYEKFLNSDTAQHEVLLELSEKNKVKKILTSYQKQLGVKSGEGNGNADRNANGNADENADAVMDKTNETTPPPAPSSASSSSSQKTSLTSPPNTTVVRTTTISPISPPTTLFIKARDIVLEDMRKVVFARFLASDEGRRRLALLSVLDPEGAAGKRR